MRLVAEAPLGEWHIAVVPRPHLGRLQFEPGAQAHPVEFFDVQIRLSFTHQACPVVETLTAQFEPHVHPGRSLRTIARFQHATTPPPPCLHGSIGVACFIGGAPPAVKVGHGSGE